MLVPFKHSEKVIGCIRQIVLLYGRLFNTSVQWNDCYGVPILPDFMYSVNLGVGLGYPTRCLTDQKGFLCLEESSPCCVDENTMPPLSIYANNLTVQGQITRVFGLYNFVDSNSVVAGRRVVMCLLKDLHDTGKVFLRFEIFLLLLKRSSGNENVKIIGGIGIRNLDEILAQSRMVKWPMVFSTVKGLFKNDAEKIAKICVERVSCLRTWLFSSCSRK